MNHMRFYQSFIFELSFPTNFIGNLKALNHPVQISVGFCLPCYNSPQISKRKVKTKNLKTLFKKLCSNYGRIVLEFFIRQNQKWDGFRITDSLFNEKIKIVENEKPDKSSYFANKKTNSVYFRLGIKNR